MSERVVPALLTLSDKGKTLVADREGLELKTYLDERGIPTIGIGHTSAAGPPKVIEGMTITKDKAWEIFRTDNKRFREECIKLVRVPLHQHEFDALASFIFNLGSTQFAGSTALKRLNASDYKGCAEAMLWWNQPSGVRSRRKAEHDQFLDIQHVARAA
jgi:lysozyme